MATGSQALTKREVLFNERGGVEAWCALRSHWPPPVSQLWTCGQVGLVSAAPLTASHVIRFINYRSFFNSKLHLQPAKCPQTPGGQHNQHLDLHRAKVTPTSGRCPVTSSFRLVEHVVDATLRAEGGEDVSCSSAWLLHRGCSLLLLLLSQIMFM